MTVLLRKKKKNIYIYIIKILIKILAKMLSKHLGFKIFREGGTLGLVIKVEYRLVIKKHRIHLWKRGLK